jgi:hypothetical protein
LFTSWLQHSAARHVFYSLAASRPEQVPQHMQAKPSHEHNQSEFHEHVGELNICPNIEVALERASEIHDRVFGSGEGR